jgi:hypothetical protein
MVVVDNDFMTIWVERIQTGFNQTNHISTIVFLSRDAFLGESKENFSCSSIGGTQSCVMTVLVET